MKQKKAIINCGYNKKIFCVRYIKTIIINNILLFLIFVFLSSCNLNESIKELEINVTKVGKIDFPANYILLYPHEYDDSLSYKALINNITTRLEALGFNRVINKENAKYAFLLTFNILNKHIGYKNKNNILHYHLNDSEEISNIELDKFVKRYKHKTFIFEAYLINKNVTDKIFEGYTIQIYNSDLKELDRGFLGFLMCSIDALFDKSLLNTLSYQEYYYKCL